MEHADVIDIRLRSVVPLLAIASRESLTAILATRSLRDDPRLRRTTQ